MCNQWRFVYSTLLGVEFTCMIVALSIKKCRPWCRSGKDSVSFHVRYVVQLLGCRLDLFSFSWIRESELPLFPWTKLLFSQRRSGIMHGCDTGTCGSP